MSRRVTSDFTILIVFFGGAMIDAIRHGEWAMSAVYIGLALLFLFSARHRSATTTADRSTQ